MKKNNIFYACAAAALVFASCQKEAPAPEMPQAEGMNVITATTLSTKTTTQDGVNVLWENGDQIKLFSRMWNEGANKFDAGWCEYFTTLDTPSATATFVKDEANAKVADNSSSKYIALYVKGASIVTQSRDYNMQFALGKEIKVKNGGDFAASVMVAASETPEFQFSHLVSYIKFVVDENSTPFRKLTVSSANPDQVVVSRIIVDFKDGNLTSALATGKSQDSKTMAVTTDDGADFAPGTYYVAINPATYAEGLKFTFENDEYISYAVTTPSNVVMEAGDVANMGTIGTLEFPEPPVTPEEPETPGLGSVYAENGNNLGVVFWVDEADPTKGKIISGASTSLEWGNGTAKVYDWAADVNTEDGMANQAYVLGLEGSTATEYPAVYYCKDMGEGWRLPTISEMEALIKTYYGLSGDYDTTTKYFEVEPYASNAVAFEAELNKCNPTAPLATSTATWYWTGQSYYKDGDNNSGKMCRVKISSQILVSGANATNACNVRCVRDVVLQ